MNIIFENIEINNFLAIQHAKFNLKNNGFVLINGINNNKDDNAKSNGALSPAKVSPILCVINTKNITKNTP